MGGGGSTRGTPSLITVGDHLVLPPISVYHYYSMYMCGHCMCVQELMSVANAHTCTYIHKLLVCVYHYFVKYMYVNSVLCSGKMAECSLCDVGYWRAGVTSSGVEHILHWHTLLDISSGQHRQREIISSQRRTL